MRKLVGMVSLAALAACSGQDPESAGSIAPAGSQGVAATASSDSKPGSFVSPTITKTYNAPGTVQSYGYNYTERVSYAKDVVLNAAGKPVLDANGFATRKLNPDSRTIVGTAQTDQLYSGDAATVRTPGITVTYDPRNAIYTLTIAQDGVAQSKVFQDPAHRTDFSGARTPQPGVPNLEIGDPTAWRTKGVQYLQADNGSSGKTTDIATFFYELPGTTTKYVTYAGYVRNRYEAPSETVVTDSATGQVTDFKRRTQLDRAAFVYGEQTPVNAVPSNGTATYAGNMIASMVNNPNFENDAPTYFQWISGQATTTVNFTNNSVSTSLTGTVGAPLLDTSPIQAPTAGTPVPMPVSIPEGSTFSAAASARIDLVGTGGFTGTFSDAHFTNGPATQKVDIVGSTIDGAFYGPKAEEVGASFRIVGGIPDQRVDVVGSFTGAKPN